MFFHAGFFMPVLGRLNAGNMIYRRDDIPITI
jgi:hypothetical protein